MSAPSDDGPAYVDGRFGPKTRAVIERFREEEAERERLAELLAAAFPPTARQDRWPWWRLTSLAEGVAYLLAGITLGFAAQAILFAEDTRTLRLALVVGGLLWLVLARAERRFARPRRRCSACGGWVGRR